MGALFLGCVGAPVAKAPDVAKVIVYPLSEYDQQNGLRVVIERAPDYGVGGVVLLVGAGATEEAPDQAGLAHLVEHLAFHSRPRGTLDLEDTFSSLGVASHNGMTDWDSTSYYAFGPTQSTPELVEVLLSVLADPLAGVSEADFRHELAIVKNEQRYRAENGTPGQAIGWLTSSTLPDGHPYKHPVVGTQSSLDALTLERARAFAKQHYRPSVATLVVSGPMDPTSLRMTVDRASAERFAGAANARHEAKIPGGAATPPHGALQTRDAPVDSPTLWLGWPVPGGFSQDSDVLELLSGIGAYEFWSDVGGREGDIGSATSGGLQGVKGGLFFLRLALNEGRDPDATASAAVRQMLHGLSARVHQSSWFETLKRDAATSLTYAEEGIVSRNLNLAWSAAFANDPLYRRLRSERIVALDADTVSTYYDRYLSGDKARSVLVRPGNDAGLPAPTHAVSAEAQPDAGTQLPPTDPARSRSWMRSLGLARGGIGKLRNGVELVVVPKVGSPFHSVVLGFRGGAVADTPPGTRLATSWAREYTRLPPSVWGVSHSSDNGVDMMSESLRSTGSDIGFTLKQLDDAMAFPISWPTPQFTSRLAVARQEERSPRGSLERRAHRALFGQHLYGAWPTADQLRDISATRVYGYVDAIRRPDNALLVMVGDFDENNAVAEAQKTIGHWTLPARSPPLSVRAPEPLTAAAEAGTDLLVQHLTGTTLAQLSLRCVLPPLDDSSYGSALIFEALVDNVLFGELRERLGAAYAVDTQISILRGGSATFEVNADVDYAELERAARAFRRLAEQPFSAWIDADDLNLARASVARGYNLSRATSLGLAQEILAFWKNDWPIASIDKVPDQVFATRVDDVARIAQHCQRNRVVAALGDEGRIRDAWRRSP